MLEPVERPTPEPGGGDKNDNAAEDNAAEQIRAVAPEKLQVHSRVDLTRLATERDSEDAPRITRQSRTA